ncbi:HNH endonuclease signature motif containing protein [Paraburkholderia sp. J11-2]|uniref:HNH endonuclease n=1 Tax=Paraburkholderia sp. J11-2 TaxID=2805431 RepID=UPI002AB6B89B|nr:HNH endonuclease signature motif containing protein [Paraburkholderia sp. J11-2]
MKLTKAQREQLRQMFGGRCAYCGEPLPNRWHADHREAVVRAVIPKEMPNGRYKLVSGDPHFPERDTLENMMPSCPPCNIDKSMMSLESWRQKLARSVEVLVNNYPTYRHAKRFGLIEETGAAIVFYFERVAAQQEAA